MKKQTKELFMYIFAAVIMAFLFGFLILIAVQAIPPENEKLVYTSAGVAFGWGSAIVFFFFGSSKSSSDKTEMMNDNVQK